MGIVLDKDMENLKKCTKCKKWKKTNCFGIEKRTKIGLQSRCKECINEHSRKNWYDNHEKNLLRKKKYRDNNRDTLNKDARIRYYSNLKENRIKSCEHQKKYYRNNFEKLKEKAKIYAKNNRDKILIRERKWAKNNPDLYKAKNRRSNLKHKQKRKTDSKIRIHDNMSNLIRIRLKKRLSSKNGKSTFNFLPYTIDDLIKHLEQQFTKRMTWDNYGKWHIDHIKPDSLFHYKSVDGKEFQECWALNNLQPLWAEDNRKKGKSYEE